MKRHPSVGEQILAPFPFLEQVRELRAHAGTQFDPDVVDAFLRVLDRRGGRI